MKGSGQLVLGSYGDRTHLYVECWLAGLDIVLDTYDDWVWCLRLF